MQQVKSCPAWLGCAPQNPHGLLRFLWNSLTSQDEMLIVPTPPQGGIFNFFEALSWAVPYLVPECREGL